MRIGVVSDTHNHLSNVGRIVEIFNEARVDRVVHTGDITQAKTLEVFARLEAPLVGVFGNNDIERESLDGAAQRLGIRLSDPPLEFSWADQQIVVVHDPRDLDTQLRANHTLALHGHTHMHVNEPRENAWVFNPGECAGHMSGHNAVGIVDLADLSIERPRF